MASEPKIKLRFFQMVLAAPNVVYTKFSFFSTLCSSSLSNEDSRLEKMPPADSDSF